MPVAEAERLVSELADELRASRMSGRAYLVGAGPGDPGLITVRGRELLESAEVVMHDRLGTAELLPLADSTAEIIDVGKAPGDVAMTQDEINATPVRAGRFRVPRGRRLKGGDPFVFGRGGEEAIALAAAGLPFEIVPGITSAIAAPAYAGIPVTHRAVATSVTVVTGHEDPAKPADPDRLGRPRRGARNARPTDVRAPLGDDLGSADRRRSRSR